MVKVEIYTKDYCPFCQKALKLLTSKGVDFTRYELESNADPKREEMIKRTGGKSTVPQIFIDDQSIGGCDDIHALDGQGKLDALLSA